VSWMHNPCSGHVDSFQIWGPPLIGQCFIWITYDKWSYFIG
jgi:hypothetical protein